MSFSERWRHLGETRLQRVVMMVVGVFLVLLAGLTAPLPGPWSIPIFAAGFGMMLKASRWVKKRYVRFARKFPKSGTWVDWGMRRPSYLRRRARDEAAQNGAGACGDAAANPVQLAKSEPRPVDHDGERHR